MIRRIESQAEGWVFTPDAFLDLGSRRAVDMALARQLQRGNIRRLSRGLYDRPKHHPQLGVLAPSVEAIAEAVKGRDAVRLQPSGAYAANLLGLSDQIPMKVVFLTDGPSRHIKIDNREILFKRTTPRNMATAGRISGTVIQALRWLGKRHVDDAILSLLQQRLTAEEKQILRSDIRYAPAWIGQVIRAIVGQERT
ncbi:MAG TPA: DUF6088 family protein [Candidatus Hydrogenedentes bacterium]|nr:DUF6088 family protein [Candidatus Hydrogenedentota bacterium]